MIKSIFFFFLGGGVKGVEIHGVHSLNSLISFIRSSSSSSSSSSNDFSVWYDIVGRNPWGAQSRLFHNVILIIIIIIIQWLVCLVRCVVRQVHFDCGWLPPAPPCLMSFIVGVSVLWGAVSIRIEGGLSGDRSTVVDHWWLQPPSGRQRHHHQDNTFLPSSTQAKQRHARNYWYSSQNGCCPSYWFVFVV